MYKGQKIIDSHIHYALPIEADELVELMNSTGTDMANLVIVPSARHVSSVPDALMAKAMYPERFYVYASLDASAYYLGKKGFGRRMAKYCAKMLDCGCDGIKILEGKPQIRKILPVPDFDEPCWEDFFAWAEDNQAPIIWHLNDPEEFWDETKAPDWAKERNWLYDESYVNNEAQYTQVKNVLDRHPRLKIIFAHFLFFSAQYERLREWMDSYPNIMVDLTPGIEMYQNFSADIKRAREIFDRYPSRIVYGTDIGARAVLSAEDIGSSGRDTPELSREESVCRCSIVREFLSSCDDITVEADGNFLVGDEDFVIHGMGLPPEQLEKIFCGNFVEFTGGAPKALSPGLIIAFCRKVRLSICFMTLASKGMKPDFSAVDRVIKYFKGRR